MPTRPRPVWHSFLAPWWAVPDHQRKFAVVSKSPLTGRYNDSLVSSGFAIAGKRTGADALVVTGEAREPSVLVIDDGRIELLPASDLWGMTTSQTHGPARATGQRFRTRRDRPSRRKPRPLRDDFSRRPPRGPGRKWGGAGCEEVKGRRGPWSAALRLGRSQRPVPLRERALTSLTGPGHRQVSRTGDRRPTSWHSIDSRHCRHATSNGAASTGPSGLPRRR